MPLVRAIVILAGLVGLATPGQADQTDPRLNALFERLRTVEAPARSSAIENEIWQIWHVAPDERTQLLLDGGIRAMRLGDYRSAMEAFDQVVAVAPEFAEGWNKRATLHYLLNDLESSLADIDATLALEPKHFGALSGRGLVYLRMEEYEKAAAAFEAVLAIGPQMAGARGNLDALREILGQQDI